MRVKVRKSEAISDIHRSTVGVYLLVIGVLAGEISESAAAHAMGCDDIVEFREFLRRMERRAAEFFGGLPDPPMIADGSDVCRVPEDGGD